MANILVVDDQKSLRKNLAFYLKSQGFDTSTTESGEGALELIKDKGFDIVISDHKFSGNSGYELIKKTQELNPSTNFIITTTHGTIPMAVDAVKNGASDFMQKPFEYSEILDTVQKILKEDSKKHSEFLGNIEAVMIAGSQKMKDLADLAQKAAASDISVLIDGEIGTGRKLFAETVHNQSHRHKNNFVIFECNDSESSLSEGLFGIDDNNKDKGALAKADGGTLFLRDIDKLSPSLQSRLLRFLLDGTYFPDNSPTIRKSDVRLIASSSKNLKNLVNNGGFREDLYYQVNILPVYVPPLRARDSDIEPLVNYFIDKYNKIYGRTIKGVSPEALTWMNNYDWPGNVQELENILKRACALAESDILDESLIFTLPQDKPETEETPGYMNVTLQDNQKSLILKTLKQNNNNFSRTARQLGISRTTLWRRMKKFKIEGIEVGK
jgi:DNA-binding NtrC family response regulator